MKYTPTLEVSERSEITKVRELPAQGEVLVAVGDKVSAEDVVLRVMLPGEIEVVRVGDLLGVEDATGFLKISVGESVSEGQVLAETPGFLGYFKEQVRSPIAGTVEYFTAANNHLAIRGQASSLEVKAYISGTVKEIVPGRSVAIGAEVSIVQGVFGLGGEKYGEVLALDISNDAEVRRMDLEKIGLGLCGKILVGGRSFSREAFDLAAEYGVSAIVTGSIESADLRRVLGYELGVSITGDENLPFTLIITEGFGRLPIGERVINLAKRIHGQRASVNGATQVRAGAMRPELLVSPAIAGATSANSKRGDLCEGSEVRILCYPHYGALGIVEDLPQQPEVIPSGAIVRVLRITMGNGQSVTVPRSNVELV
jgi:hypothetical protein